MKAEALAHKGYRTDLTSVQVVPKLATEQIAEDAGTSKELLNAISVLPTLFPKSCNMWMTGVSLLLPPLSFRILTSKNSTTFWNRWS